ncbi:hypothetical protein ACIA5D_50535 [Actinoplanes sp. NPDC051513]|uniref:hypothetical protein n=1 Tax=Actinoplanes sp. NPDC051513 TaxID=3363908 RepID=UPI00379EDC5A
MPSGDPPPNPPASPDDVHTLAELAAALNRLRGSRSYKTLMRAAPSLRQSTLSDLLKGKSVPTRVTVVAFLSACGLETLELEPWLAAWERVRTSHLRKPPGAMRVRDADPRRLGVHASIQVNPGVDDLPVYVPRDLDAELRTAITAAAARGGFVLVKGSSSVGKTRSLFETVRAVLPDWWLLQTANAAAVKALAEAPAPRTVVWLDELQGYLSHPGGITAGAVRLLLEAGSVVVGTLWPSEYAVRAALRTPGQPDPFAEDRELLGLARIVDVPEAFSPAERRRAEELAPADARIRSALDTADAGLTQVLAAGPELVRWWEHADGSLAPQSYGKAVITAALDARRVGADMPLTADFFDQAARTYLTSAQQATSPGDWLAQAIDYAATPLHGAAACLAPVAARMGETAGWVTADYLHQHALQLRRTTVVPDSVWCALAACVDDVDAFRIADQAERRGQIDHAIALYRRAADGGAFAAPLMLSLLVTQDRLDEAVAALAARPYDNPIWTIPVERLVLALIKHDRFEEALALIQDRPEHLTLLRARDSVEFLCARGRRGDAIALLRVLADVDNIDAAMNLSSLLADDGETDELRRLADRGIRMAGHYLARQLADRGAVEDLRQRADAGDADAGGFLARLLASDGKIDELQQRADRGDGDAATTLADLLLRLGRLEEAEVLLQQQAAAGDSWALHSLTRVLADQGRYEGAIAALTRHVEAGANADIGDLVRLLTECGRVEEAIDYCRQRLDFDDEYAAASLADLWIQQGRVDDAIALLSQWPPGQPRTFAPGRLVDLMAEQGRVEELRERADAGDLSAPHRLAEVLTNSGGINRATEELRQLAEAGVSWAPGPLADLLAEQGRVDELRQRADAGDFSAARRLGDLLVDQGRVDELELEVVAGTPGAFNLLSGLRRDQTLGLDRRR